MSLNRLQSIGRLAAIGAASTLAGYTYSQTGPVAETPKILFHSDAVTPPRQEHITRLAQGTRDNPFDVLIIGGGATGTGCALDAATRQSTLQTL